MSHHVFMQDWSIEDANSADVALGRFGREAAAAGSGAAQDADVLSAATAVQRWELDHRRKEAAEEAAQEAPLMRPTLPAGSLWPPRMISCCQLQLLKASMVVNVVFGPYGRSCRIAMQAPQVPQIVAGNVEKPAWG